MSDARRHDREIVRLAVPAFLALVSEPLYLLADAAIVGHLGTPELAGLGVAAAVVQTAVGLCVFLAYGSTAAVARRVGAGDPRGALVQGVDGLWLAAGLGVVISAAGYLLTDELVGLFRPGPDVAAPAVTYLSWAWLGITPLLVSLAGTGVLRGLQDTRTPLYVAVAANLANIGLNLLLVYGLDLGIAGAAIGTDLAQTGAATAFVLVVVRAARRERATLRPKSAGVRRAARAGVPLVVRTLTLRANLLVATYAATALGAPALAAHQLALTLWTLLAFALDALAIAAQAITGRYLGSGDRAATRAVTDRMTRLGVRAGVAAGVLLAVASPLLGPLFTPDPQVRELLLPVLWVAAAMQPLAGVVFVLDGVLIGAGDGRYLAVSGLLTLAAFPPLAALALLPDSPATGLLWLWVAFGLGFLGSRALVLLARARGERWMVTGH